MHPEAARPQPGARGRGRIHDSVLELVGDTPLVRVPRLNDTAADLV
jgi:hypothetical protein